MAPRSERARARAPLAVGAVIACALLAPCAAAGQADAPFASAFVSPDHWALAAARRLDALGLVEPAFDLGRRTIARGELLRLFERAASEADGAEGAVEALTDAYVARFREEFPATAAMRAGEIRPGLGDAQATLRYERRVGRVRAGVGYSNDASWTGVRPLPDAAAGAVALRWAPSLGRYSAAVVRSAVRRDTAVLGEAYLVGRWKAIGLWGGRRALGFTPGAGGIVLARGATFDGGGVFTARPVPLPGFLSAIGPVHVDAFLARLHRNDRFEHPWLWAIRGAFSPHERVTLGLTRGVMFGGDGNTGLDLRTLAYMIVGKHSGEQGEYDNQIFAIDVRVRPPVGRLPLVAYLEWGMDDSAGAWRDVPGVVVGAEVPAVPGLPALAVGLERTAFAASCCGNTMWYRNWSFRGGWTDAGEPLGHPLGGHGTEWRLSLRAAALDARLHGGLELFLRDRGEENLFAPERAGESAGGALTLAARALPSVDVFVSAFLETERGERGADGWDAHSLETGLRIRFGPDPSPGGRAGPGR